MTPDATRIADLVRLVEALPEPHVLCRVDGSVVHLSEAARRRLGDVAALATPDGPPRDSLRTALRGWARSGAMRPGRVVLHLASGVAEEVQVQGARVGDALLLLRLDEGPGSSSFAFLSLQRRTDHVEAVRQRLERTLAELAVAHDRLERQNEMLEEYAAFVSHDLRAPLALVQGALELLEDEPDPEMADELLAAALRAIGHAQEAASAVLGLIRFTPERPQSAADVRAAVRSVAPTLPGLVVDDEACRGHHVLVPETHLERLVRNLLENALRYRAEEREPAVTVSASRLDGRVELRFADNGRGIPAELQGDIFTLFRRGRSDDSDGSGVGLASCRRIVRAYDGDLRVESDGVSGSTFVLDLPAGTAP